MSSMKSKCKCHTSEANSIVVHCATTFYQIEDKSEKEIRKIAPLLQFTCFVKF